MLICLFKVENMRLKNKHVVITGASRGLGRALALRFIAEGACISICARNTITLNETVILISDSDRRVFSQTCDVGNSFQSQSFISKSFDRFGQIDALINNASIFGIRSTINEYPIGTWDEVVQSNINGLFFITKNVIPIMMQKKSGAIINVSAAVGRAGRAQWGAFSVSKFASEGFTQVLSEELKNLGITVNSVNPGAMATTLRKIAAPNDDQTILRTPEQLTDIFVYLASDDGKGISGQSFDASTFITNPRVLQ
jgi:NAD(P)-dependent dehydrogenase (short-subunit alcohol dehydrogenase family)